MKLLTAQLDETTCLPVSSYDSEQQHYSFQPGHTEASNIADDSYSLLNGVDADASANFDRHSGERPEERLRDEPSPFDALCPPALFESNDHQQLGQQAHTNHQFKSQQHRYYVNKLYQPPKGAPDLICESSSSSSSASSPPPSPLVERDQEHLLYQGLKFLDSSGEDMSSAESDQLTKILVDDEDDDANALVDHMNRANEDPLHPLQLTTIIDGFDSFPSSPLISACNPAPSDLMDTSEPPGAADYARPEVDATYEQACAQPDDQLQLDFDHMSQRQQVGGHYLNQLEQDYGDQFDAGPATSDRGCFAQVSSSYQVQAEDIEDENPNSSSSTAKRKSLDETEQPAPKAKVSRGSWKSAKRRAGASAREPPISDERTSNSVSSTYNVVVNNKARKSAVCSEPIETDLSLDDEASSSADRSKQPQINVYRRRTANARERIRMREINQAFEKLKKVVPIEMIQQVTNSGDESDQNSCNGRGKISPQSDSSQSIKLTKITTLRLAVSYIAKLSEVLNQQPEGNLSSSSANQSSPTGARQAAGSLAADQSPSVGKLAGNKDLNAAGRPRAKPTERKRRDLNSTQSADRSTAPQSLELGTPTVVGQQADEAGPSHPPAPNQLNQTQQTILLNNVCQTFASIQQQQQQVQKQAQPAQLAYAQQQLTGDGRTFVTPVAVAILGIPSGQDGGQPQTLQLLSLPASNQQRNLQQSQPASPYNLIAPQPQQVTLTLDDISGLSVLRLANPAGVVQQPIQLQQNRSQLIKQPQTQLVTTASGARYNLAPYQPIQIAQVQAQGQQLLEADQQGAGRVTSANMTTQSNPSTGINNSDCKSTSIAHNCQLISANPPKQQQLGATLNGSNHFLPANHQLVAIAAPHGQLYQPAQVAAGAAGQAQTGHLIYFNPSPSNISGSVGSEPSVQPNNGVEHTNQKVKLVSASQLDSSEHNGLKRATSLQAASEANIRKLVANLTTSIHHSPPEKNSASQIGRSQAAFGTLKSSVEQTNGCLKYHYQASGRQEQQQHHQAAYLDKQQPASVQSQSQPKKTYRFHNYDGNMISNHLYSNNSSTNNNGNSNNNSSSSSSNTNSSNHDKHQQQPKRLSQAPDVVSQTGEAGQRSRQNSLSSNCSTSSTISSSLASSSPDAPIMSAALKSSGLG